MTLKSPFEHEHMKVGVHSYLNFQREKRENEEKTHQDPFLQFTESWSFYVAEVTAISEGNMRLTHTAAQLMV